jgi:hypothetical protein
MPIVKPGHIVIAPTVHKAANFGPLWKSYNVARASFSNFYARRGISSSMRIFDLPQRRAKEDWLKAHT